MSLDEFNLLSEDDKISLLWYKAKLIAERQHNASFAYLYQLNSFYIEVLHTGNFIERFKLRAFSSTDELEPYLEQIDISNLIR